MKASLLLVLLSSLGAVVSISTSDYCSITSKHTMCLYEVTNILKSQFFKRFFLLLDFRVLDGSAVVSLWVEELLKRTRGQYQMSTTSEQIFLAPKPNGQGVLNVCLTLCLSMCLSSKNWSRGINQSSNSLSKLSRIYLN